MTATTPGPSSPGVPGRPEDHVGTPSRFPAMVTLGSLPGGRVGLLNLAHAGCLHLNGDEGTARRLMSAWALELATTPRADALDVVAVGIHGLPDGLERLTTLRTPTSFARSWPSPTRTARPTCREPSSWRPTFPPRSASSFERRANSAAISSLWSVASSHAAATGPSTSRGAVGHDSTPRTSPSTCSISARKRHR